MPDGEFFALRPEEVDDALIEHGPFGQYQVVEANNLMSVELATLGEILGAGSYDDLVVRLENEGRPSANSEAALLMLPTQFRDALADMHDVEAIAEAWAATEELVMTGYRTEHALLVLRELAPLAREAQTDRRELWIWVSL
jgi:hypothetical protein